MGFRLKLSDCLASAAFFMGQVVTVENVDWRFIRSKLKYDASLEAFAS